MFAEQINAFEGEHARLSNFSRVPVFYKGVLFDTSEHAYQWAKCVDTAQANTIAKAATPGRAKRLGNSRSLLIREDWESVKIDIMFEILTAKFSPGSEAAAYLLSTGDAYLNEGNTWGDRFWGTVKGKGENMLGKLLMKVRQNLRAAGQ